jgi:hypothetical protein
MEDQDFPTTPAQDCTHSTEAAISPTVFSLEAMPELDSSEILSQVGKQGKKPYEERVVLCIQ